MSEFDRAIVAYAKYMEVTEKDARQEAEQMIAYTMKENGWSREFAVSSWIEDTLDGMEETVEEMTQAAKDNGTDKVNAKAVDAYGKKRTRTRKPNDEKRELINVILSALVADCDYITNAHVENQERQIDFSIENRHYSLVLTQHRPPKAKN